jgi:hypothetical protein
VSSSVASRRRATWDLSKRCRMHYMRSFSSSNGALP